MTVIVLECVCAVMAGARYWELSLDRELYFRSWVEKTSQLDCEGCPELPAKVEGLAPVVHVGMCVPELCSGGEVREELLSRALASSEDPYHYSYSNRLA